MVAGDSLREVRVTDTKVDSRTASQAFTRAVGLAAFAPSAANSQSWSWRLADGICELWVQRERQLGVSDPDGRQTLLSCGAALHHAQMALAAEGWGFDVDRLPERGNPDLMARLRLTGQTAPDASAVRLSYAVHLRYTDRRPLCATRLDDEVVTAIASAAEAKGARLCLLHRDQVGELGAIAEIAQEIEMADSAWLEELAYWSSGWRPTDMCRVPPDGWCPTGTGIPAGAVPDRPLPATVPNKDFGVGSLPIGPGGDSGATFGLLCGDEDEPKAWLPAGEALSAAWLTAAELGVSLLPMSAPVEITSTREALCRLISGASYPYLVLRLGIADTTKPPPERTPRLPLGMIISESPT
jgi:hypothetical protein